MLKSDWKVTALDLLKRFYEFAGFDRKTSMPSWLDFFEEQKDIEGEVGEKKFMGLRAFLVEEITRCYSLNNGVFSSDTDPDINKDLFYTLLLKKYTHTLSA